MSEWISVKDRLPERHVEVLVYPNTDAAPVSSWVCSDGHWVLNPFVTHWMPLPEPPKEKK